MRIFRSVGHVETGSSGSPATGQDTGLTQAKGNGEGAFIEEAVLAPGPSRERLLSFLVHEIRNPLASALWSVEMLSKQALPDPRQARLAELAVRSARRLRGLIEDVFTLERLPEEAPPGHCNLRAAVEKALEPRQIESAGIRAQIEGPAGVEIELDAGAVDKLLHAIVRRLIHVGPPGTVLAEIAQKADRGLLTISREGVTPEAIEPPALTTGGSEGGGTTFAMFIARLAARRFGVPLSIEATDHGSAIHLEFRLHQT